MKALKGDYLHNTEGKVTVLKDFEDDGGCMAVVLPETDVEVTDWEPLSLRGYHQVADVKKVPDNLRYTKCWSACIPENNAVSLFLSKSERDEFLGRK